MTLGPLLISESIMISYQRLCETIPRDISQYESCSHVMISFYWESYQSIINNNERTNNILGILWYRQYNACSVHLWWLLKVLLYIKQNHAQGWLQHDILATILNQFIENWIWFGTTGHVKYILEEQQCWVLFWNCGPCKTWKPNTISGLLTRNISGIEDRLCTSYKHYSC